MIKRTALLAIAVALVSVGGHVRVSRAGDSQCMLPLVAAGQPICTDLAPEIGLAQDLWDYYKEVGVSRVGSFTYDTAKEDLFISKTAVAQLHDKHPFATEKWRVCEEALHSDVSAVTSANSQWFIVEDSRLIIGIMLEDGKPVAAKDLTEIKDLWDLTRQAAFEKCLVATGKEV